MTDKQATAAHAMAKRVAKESDGVSVKLGRTNGLPVLHLKHNRFRTSQTIHPHEWPFHPWHRDNAPRKETASNG